MKRCTKCGVEKPKSEFNKHSSHKDSLSSYCKICKQVSNRAYNETHREPHRARCRAYRAAHLDKYRANSRAWAAAHPEQCRANSREQYRKNSAHYIHKACKRQRSLEIRSLWGFDEANAIFRKKHELNAECGESIWEVHHIVAVMVKDAQGKHIASGLHVPQNLILVTRDEHDLIHSIHGNRLTFLENYVKNNHSGR